MSKNLIAFTTSELVPQRFIEFAWFCLLHELHSARFWPWRTACSAEAMLSAHVRAVCEDTEMQESNAIQRVETKLRWFDLVCFCRLQRSWGHGVHFRSIFFERSSRTQSVKKQQSASTTEVFMPLPSSTILYHFLLSKYFQKKECQWPQHFSSLRNARLAKLVLEQRKARGFPIKKSDESHVHLSTVRICSPAVLQLLSKPDTLIMALCYSSWNKEIDRTKLIGCGKTQEGTSLCLKGCFQGEEKLDAQTTKFWDWRRPKKKLMMHGSSAT